MLVSSCEQNAREASLLGPSVPSRSRVQVADKRLCAMDQPLRPESERIALTNAAWALSSQARDTHSATLRLVHFSHLPWNEDLVAATPAAPIGAAAHLLLHMVGHVNQCVGCLGFFIIPHLVIRAIAFLFHLPHCLPAGHCARILPAPIHVQRHKRAPTRFAHHACVLVILSDVLVRPIIFWLVLPM